MIFRLAKFLLKLIFGSILTIGIFVLVILFAAKGCTSWYAESNPEVYTSQPTNVIMSHQICEAAPIGTGHACCLPSCQKVFTKVRSDINCCSYEHEQVYQDFYKKWMHGQSYADIAEKYGIAY